MSLLILKKDQDAIYDGKAVLIGETPWEKDFAYQIYQIEDRFEDRYVAVVVYNSMNRDLMMETAEYIIKDKIGDYLPEFQEKSKSDTVKEYTSEQMHASELYDALKNLVEKVETLSLWDKTDSEYYTAKQLLEKIEGEDKP